MNTNLKALQGKLTREFLEGLKGGGTISPYSLTRVTKTSGYMVAITNNTCTEDEVAGMIAKVAYECRGLDSNPIRRNLDIRTFVGVWFDGEVWYVDQSRLIEDKKLAIEVAVAHDQQSIFGWAEMDCIDTFGKGGKN